MGLGGRLAQGAWEPLWTTPTDDAGTWALVGYLTMPAAVLLTAAPHLAKPVRRLARWLALSAAVAAVVLDAAPSAVVEVMLIASVAAIVCAARAYCLIHVLIKPTPEYSVVAGETIEEVPNDDQDVSRS